MQYLLLLFVAGVASANILPSIPLLLTLLGGVGALSIVCIIALCCRLQVIAQLAGAFMLFFLGVCWVVIAMQSALNQRLPLSFEKKPVWVQGHVISLPERTTHGQRFEFNIERLQYHFRDYPIRGRVRLHWFLNPKPLLVGTCWRLPVKLKRLHGYYNPGGADELKHALTQGIVASGYVDTKRHATPCSSSARTATILRLRAYLYHHFFIKASTPIRGFLLALTLGLRQELTSGMWQVLQRTGTAHLLTVSGMHVGFIFMISIALFTQVLKALQYAGGSFNRSNLTVCLAGLVAIGYVLMTGGGIPSLRALFMVCLWCLCYCLRLRTHLSFVLLWSVVMLLVINPLAVLAHGFWLSTYAVAWIIYSCHNTLPALSGWRQLLRLQWRVSVGLLPLTMFYFHQISWVAFVCNIIAIPTVSFLILPAGLISLMATLTWPALGQCFVWFVQLTMKMLWLFLSTASSWSHSSNMVYLSAFSFWVLVLIVAILFLPMKHPLRGTVILLLPFIFLGQESTIAKKDFSVTVLDVGQGLSVFVKTLHHNLLFDTGPRYGDYFDAGDKFVTPFLLSKHAHVLDTVVISHADNDHIGGFAAVNRAFTIKRVLAGEQRENNWQQCLSGMHWQWDGVDFTILHPPLQWTAHRNERSCVMRVSSGRHSVLLTGDIEKHSEQRLTEKLGALLHAEVLIAPHHGSRTSSTHRFVDAVNPKWVVIASGYKNRYRLPSTQVISRYRKLKSGPSIYNTAELGAVQFVFLHGKRAAWKFSRVRQAQLHPWVWMS